MHPHDREDAANRDELLRCSETNGAMALDAQAIELASPLEGSPLDPGPVGGFRH
jgi:hypothetical protein